MRLRRTSFIGSTLRAPYSTALTRNRLPDRPHKWPSQKVKNLIRNRRPLNLRKRTSLTPLQTDKESMWCLRGRRLSWRTRKSRAWLRSTRLRLIFRNSSTNLRKSLKIRIMCYWTTKAAPSILSQKKEIFSIQWKICMKCFQECWKRVQAMQMHRVMRWLISGKQQEKIWLWRKSRRSTCVRFYTSLWGSAIFKTWIPSMRKRKSNTSN